MVTFVVLAVVALLSWVFRTQIGAGFIVVKRKLDKKIPTSVRIEQTINSLKKKQELVKQTFKEINTYIEKISIQKFKEEKTAIEMGEYKVIARRDITSYESRNERNFAPKPRQISQGDILTIADVTTHGRLELIGFFNTYNLCDFDVANKDSNKNLIRAESLRELGKSYLKRSQKMNELIHTIQKSIISLENDKDYVITMESLIDVAKFDDNVNTNIDNIKAEIGAIEKQLVMEEELHAVSV